MKLFKNCVNSDTTTITITSGCLSNKKIVISFDNDDESQQEILEEMINKIIERKNTLKKQRESKSNIN